MTDASPRIFRNLEKSGGRDSFDDIVLAAVADYTALERPSAAQARDFGRLVVPLYEKTDRKTRSALAAGLAASPALPRGLVERLLAEPVAVSSPFLLASPLLTADDLAALAERREAGLERILQARTDPEKPAASRRKKPASTSPVAGPEVPTTSAPGRLSSARQTALLSAGTPAPAQPVPNAHRASTPVAKPIVEAKSAEEALALLRQLVLAGRSGDTAAPSPAASDLPVARPDLMALALNRDEDGFHSLLSNKLLLDPDEAAAIRVDDTGRELAVALKALGFERSDALTMLMMLKKNLGSDVAAFEAMGAFYASLNERDCAARFDDGSSGGKRTLRPAYVETNAPHRAEPRRIFGRRTSMPGGIERRRRNT